MALIVGGTFISSRFLDVGLLNEFVVDRHLLDGLKEWNLYIGF